MGKGRKWRHVTPWQDGGARTLTSGAVSDLRWADGVVHGDRCQLVLGDTGPFAAGELCVAWVGDRPDQGWRSLYVESAFEGRVLKAKWLRMLRSDVDRSA
jgi:hypothetical protein